MATESLEIQRQLDPRHQSQHDGVTPQARDQHDEFLGIIHQLEAELAAAARGRERDWAQECVADLRRLRELMHDHVEPAGAEDGYFTNWRLRHRTGFPAGSGFSNGKMACFIR